ncbi:hypothetical protein GIY62_28200 [Burkholderia plantarii]|uniref:hypothetical protein n=1 Tax=Burkholderia plantarii TaxID=41899 RepID=UPI0027299895|nr:hypothetical protein [Burkholderia plantarii]WLE61353.1 hypothetical protein GIY62_28200 [Burkholderia plantarii]
MQKIPHAARYVTPLKHHAARCGMTHRKPPAGMIFHTTMRHRCAYNLLVESAIVRKPYGEIVRHLDGGSE